MVVEERYSQVFKLDHVWPSVVADAIVECQIRFPTVPIIFCDTRKLAQEWTYRFLAAARACAGGVGSRPVDACRGHLDQASAPAGEGEVNAVRHSLWLAAAAGVNMFEGALWARFE